MEKGNEQIGKREKINLIGLYARNMEANIIGFMTIIILNYFTPLESLRVQKNYLFEEGRWTTFFLFIPLVIILVMLIQYSVQRPIALTVNSINTGKSVRQSTYERSRKRILNLPYIIAFINISIYIIIPFAVSFVLFLVYNISFKNFLFLYFRSIMLGLIVMFISLLLIEDTIRKSLVPHFFPEGRLHGIPGTIWISISRRIRALFGVGTVNPMILLILTLIFIFLEVDDSKTTVQELAKGILVFSVLLCLFFLIISLRVNVLVVNSILNPIKEMLGIIEKVKKGDLSQQIKVISNDELGILGDAGNDMIRGLADREKIRETFGKYVSPEIRDQILAGNIPLNGERREATLLFSDLRDFTSYVENNPPEEVILGMRIYFTAMQKAIAKYNGLVLQYVGDEVEAVFGVPIKSNDHPEMAVKAALEMRKGLEILNEQRSKKGKPVFRHGIGIYTGSVLAGNTGSKDRLSYSLIGNTVNLASRIQEITKSYGCDILVSETTVKHIESSFPLKKEKSHSVKGYSRPITVYRLL